MLLAWPIGGSLVPPADGRRGSSENLDTPGGVEQFDPGDERGSRCRRYLKPPRLVRVRHLHRAVGQRKGFADDRGKERVGAGVGASRHGPTSARRPAA
jgi:hypothetical protein